MTSARRARVAVYRSNDEHAYLDGGVSGLLDSLPADSARALIHVLDCPTCQDTLRDYAKSKPARGHAFEKAAVLSVSLRRALRLRFPGLQTLPWT